MGHNVHDMLRKVVVYYTKDIEIFKINFWLWFEIVIIFKDETLNSENINTLSKIHIHSNVFFKKSDVLGQL
jgi:hypothetical protein